MKPCNHSHWLSLHSHHGEITFTQSDRAATLLHSLLYLESQRPSLFVLVGNRSKARALRELVSASTGKRSAGRRSYGEIHLHLDPSAPFSGRPILFADGDFPIQQNIKPSTSGKCHEVTQILLPKTNRLPSETLQAAADSIYFRLLFPFTDVFCFFALDLGGLQPIARRIAAWLDGGHPPTLPIVVPPQIIIVTESSTPEFQESQLLEHFLRLLAHETRTDTSKYFAAIRVVALLPDGHISPTARHRKLKESLMIASDQVRLQRLETGMLFSAQHFAAFLRQACSSFVEALNEPFDFIRASRVGNPPALDLKEHLTNLLTKINTIDELKNFAVPLIASSLLLDGYHPDMHLFRPRDVFRLLYKDACIRACRDGIHLQDPAILILPSGSIRMIEDSFSELFVTLSSRPSNKAVDLHHQFFLDLHHDWRAFQLDGTCLTCLRRTPRYRLPCGHCICLNCVRDFGILNEHDPWLLELESCIFCNISTSGMVIKDLPPTAGLRLLTFDGGGVRGLATLQYLQCLQEEIGLPYPVQENFDVVFGTSIGGIIAIGLSICGWTIEQATENLERYAELAFQPRSIWNTDIPLVSQFLQVIDFIISYLADSRYSADNLEAALREAFGSNRSLLDYSTATRTGTCVGVPVTTIRDTSICVFTNYNGVGTRSRDCGYHVFGPSDGSSRVPLWEIARCGSAAPFYFKPKHITGLGTFQDGGLRENDPGNLALEEAAVIHPSIDEPSLVVSLGTGSSRPSEVPRMSPSRGILQDGFIARLLRAFKLSFGSIRGHKFRSRRREGRKEQYFRFDMEFDGPEPALDDTTKMQELKAAARAAIHGSKELKRLARCVVAELFVFVLDHDPSKENGKYLCKGRILCRRRADDPAFDVLMEQLSKKSIKFFVEGHPLEGLIDNSWLDPKGNFSKRVSIELVDRRSTFTIQLREGNMDPCSISGSPFTIDGLVSAQELNAPFGTSNHRKRMRVDSADVLCRKRQRVRP
ncbi:patatin-like phospholipase-like protein [Cadophora sp. MPI-SDFR-AT-0126]|nr:patatin-like phospholipase-like protein [Leotiomycetes sp. MPI-SDFR-AT-0126]